MTWRLTFTNRRWQRRFVPELQHALPAFQFDQQRATCEACAHVIRLSSATRDVELLCTQGGHRNGCSLLRLPGQACGPDAQRFTPISPRNKP